MLSSAQFQSYTGSHFIQTYIIYDKLDPMPTEALDVLYFSSLSCYGSRSTRNVVLPIFSDFGAALWQRFNPKLKQLFISASMVLSSGGGYRGPERKRESVQQCYFLET
jgi:hypothetical protein